MCETTQHGGLEVPLYKKCTRRYRLNAETTQHGGQEYLCAVRVLCDLREKELRVFVTVRMSAVVPTSTICMQGPVTSD